MGAAKDNPPAKIESSGSVDPESTKRFFARLRKGKTSRRIETDAELQLRDARQDVNLKRAYGYGALWAVGIQIVVADAVFLIYGFSDGWKNVPPSAISAWLAATVIQIVGIVAIISKYLFSKESGVTDSALAARRRESRTGVAEPAQPKDHRSPAG